MANKPLRFCSWPGCSELCRDGYCDKHRPLIEKKRADEKARYQKSRPSARRAGYDADWQRCRSSYLARHPLCEMCLAKGEVKPAVLVHHIRPLSEGGSRLDTANLAAVCTACHEAIHGPDRWRRRDDGAKGRGA